MRRLRIAVLAALFTPMLPAQSVAPDALCAKGGETALAQAKKYQYAQIQTALQKAGARE